LVLTDVACGRVQCHWTTTREFIVSYPRTAGVEFAVAKTHGVAINLNYARA
jgi:hypothetical protein